jgi:hypothetical protein
LSKYKKKINPREKFEIYYNFDLAEITRVAKKLGLDYLLQKLLDYTNRNTI